MLYGYTMQSAKPTEEAATVSTAGQATILKSYKNKHRSKQEVKQSMILYMNLHPETEHIFYPNFLYIFDLQ